MKAFADETLADSVEVTAVRAESPHLFVQMVVDFEAMGLAEAPEQLIVSGEAECLATTKYKTIAGYPIRPNNLRPTLCQRTGSGLTVLLYPSAPDLTAEQGMAMTDELWRAAGGEG